MDSVSRPRVVIIGAGFAGLAAAQTLASYRNLSHGVPASQILLVDRNNYHTFAPLLSRVATTEFEPRDIAFPLRPVVRRIPGAELVLARAERIDLEERRVQTDLGVLSYDYLVLAAGSAANLGSIPGAPECAYPLNTLEQALALNNQIARCLERAVHESDPGAARKLLTFVTVGGGVRGVEYTAALAEFVHTRLRRNYPSLESLARILLIESEGRLVSELPEDVSRKILSRLHALGVQVSLSTRVQEITPQGVYVRGGGLLPAATVVWGGGMRGSSIKSSLRATRTGQVPVLSTLQVPDAPQVYVAGDLAQPESAEQPVSRTVANAIRQGRTAARNIQSQMQGLSSHLVFSPSRELFVTLGRRCAAARYEGRTTVGFRGWLKWASAHWASNLSSHDTATLLHWARLHLVGDGLHLLVNPEIEPTLEQLEVFDRRETN